MYIPLKKIKNLIKGLVTINSSFNQINEKLDQIKINQGIVLSKLNASQSYKFLHEYDFKIFSQWGEDGIIQHLINIIEIKNKTFIEFGVEDFTESNCRFLMEKNNWSGFVIDGSTANIEKIKQSSFYWKHDLNAVAKFITKENINLILDESGFDYDLGLLSVDIDGNDFHVLNAIEKYKPRILICEFNSVFGLEKAITIPYRDDFVRTKAHYSNLYYGASLMALFYWAKKNNYSFIGTNGAASNAFFVRSELLNAKLKEINLYDLDIKCKIRESRNQNGNLLYLSDEENYKLIKGMQVYNVISKKIEIL